MKILYFADIVGKLGRKGIAHQLPIWRSTYEPDAVIANGENLSHGNGMNRVHIEEMLSLGISLLTGGNHSFDSKDAAATLSDESLPIIRPLNAGRAMPGKGYRLISTVSGEQLLVINLVHQKTGKQHYNSPFEALDDALLEMQDTTPHILLDWHAERSSEKSIMGWYADGKVSAVVGSHTHVPTADEKILPHGTAYISDVGMTGPYASVIGFDPVESIKRFSTQIPAKPQLVEEGPLEINAVFIETRADGKAVHIERLRNIVEK